jgi:hyaluronoglucosaminidase
VLASVSGASTAWLWTASPALAASRAGRDNGPVAWVANRALVSDPGSTLTPVDLADRRAESPVTTASQPAAMAPWTDGRLLVVNKGRNTLSVLDTASSTVSATVEVGLQPDAVAVTHVSGKGGWLALVANFGNDTVTPVNLGTLRAGAPIPAGAQPVAVAVVPGSPGAPATALVADFAAGTVTPINLATMTPDPPIAVGTAPEAVAVQDGSSPTGPVALVADFGSDQVTPVSVDSLAAMPAVSVGGNPTGIAVAPDGTAWVVAGDTLTPLPPDSPAGGTPLTLPGVGESVALQGGSTAWVAEQAGTIVPVRLPAGPAGNPVHVGGRPTALTLTPS